MFGPIIVDLMCAPIIVDLMWCPIIVDLMWGPIIVDLMWGPIIVDSSHMDTENRFKNNKTLHGHDSPGDCDKKTQI